jgi:hypothetical protein
MMVELRARPRAAADKRVHVGVRQSEAQHAVHVAKEVVRVQLGIACPINYLPMAHGQYAIASEQEGQ